MTLAEIFRKGVERMYEKVCKKSAVRAAVFPAMFVLPLRLMLDLMSRDL